MRMQEFYLSTPENFRLNIRSDGKHHLPHWLKVPFPGGEKYAKVKNLIEKNSLHTICTSGNCPNKGECWASGTATFMILGEKCTRNCRFCMVQTAKPDPPDWDEPARLAESIKILGLKHTVITSVARDDLADGGAAFWAFTIHTVRECCPGVTIETLIPDFQGNLAHIDQIIREEPDVISHNIETVWRLTPRIRYLATYQTSLNVLRHIAESGIIAKSGIMVGHGETRQEVVKTMRDLKNQGVRVLTIGQYLQPSSYHIPVQEYISPEIFEEYKKIGLDTGFDIVESGPLVRSSYHAERHVIQKKMDSHETY